MGRRGTDGAGRTVRDGRTVEAAGECGGCVGLASHITCSFFGCWSGRQRRRRAANRTRGAGSPAAASGRRAPPLAAFARGLRASLRRARASPVAQTSAARPAPASARRPCRPFSRFLCLCASLARPLAEHRLRRDDKARAVRRCDTFFCRISGFSILASVGRQCTPLLHFFIVLPQRRA